MESTITLIILAVSAASLAISIYLAIKIKAVHYLLEQPVVKKMSPQLKLKPVKLDELMAERNRSQQQNRDARPQSGNSANPRQGGRPHGERNDSERRFENRGDRQDRRPERTEGGRPERAEGDRNRGDRPDRQGGGDRFRDRDRNRGDRPDRQGGGDRRPRETFENREPAAAPVQQSEPVQQPVMRSEAHAAPAVSHEAPLSPRRPLAATAEVGNNSNPISMSSSENETPSEVFAGSDNDVQHGRRMQLKKKPRFEFDEAEAKTEG